MNLHVLHLDDALKRQTNFMTKCHEVGALETEAEAIGDMIRLWGMQGVLSGFEQFLTTRFTKKHGAPVTFFGSGDFHHTGQDILVDMHRHFHNEAKGMAR